MGISIRHNSRIAGLVALAAAVMTVAWFSRALQTGSLTAWLWCAVVAAVGLLQLLVVRDGRAPLMVADELGVRVRRGETWSGLRWQDVERLEVETPGSWLRDGRIVLHPRSIEVQDAPPADPTDPAGEPSDRETSEAAVQVATGVVSVQPEAYVVPLGRTTKVEFDGLSGDLVTDLDDLANGRVPVLVLTRPEPAPAEPAEPAAAPSTPDELAHDDLVDDLARDEAVPDELAAPEPSAADERLSTTEPARPWRVKVELGRWAARFAKPQPGEPAQAEAEPADVSPEQDEVLDELTGDVAMESDDEPFGLGPDPVAPGRAPRPAARAEAFHESVRRLPTPPAIPVQRSAEGPVVVARVDDYAAEAPRPVENALIGPLVAAARHRARLSIDVLSERTRIRPHVLECIEVDDFEACGGDFYARGHLRTLARVFGLDAEQLVDLYDDHYAQAEIEARQVFEAELATGIGGGVRATYSGPRWSLLAACVLALAGIWGVARVFNDTPQELVSPAPNVVDSAGLANAEPETPKMTLAPLEIVAAGASPQVVVRDRDGRILWAGKLAQGQRQQVIGLAPFNVTASNGAAVKVSFLGKAKGTVGDSSAAGAKDFG